MVSLASDNELLFMEDLGSGCLVDLTRIGLPYENRVQDSVKEGVDLITFSGDKLLGGPQAGIIIGKKNAIEALKENPLARAFRCDKMTISALYQVLALYRDEDTPFEQIPVLAKLGQDSQSLLDSAKGLKNLLEEEFRDSLLIEVKIIPAEVGGGSLPGVFIESPVVAIRPINGHVNQLQEELRMLTVPIIAPIEQDWILIHIRTLQDGDDKHILEGLKLLLGEGL